MLKGVLIPNWLQSAGLLFFEKSWFFLLLNIVQFVEGIIFQLLVLETLGFLLSILFCTSNNTIRFSCNFNIFYTSIWNFKLLDSNDMFFSMSSIWSPFAVMLTFSMKHFFSLITRVNSLWIISKSISAILNAFKGIFQIIFSSSMTCL